MFGHQEDAADNFATYIMLQFGEGQAHRLIGGAAWSWRAYLGDYKRNPVVPTRLSAFAGDHGLPQERFYNLICLAVGATTWDLPTWRIIYPHHERHTARMNTKRWCVLSRRKSLRT